MTDATERAMAKAMKRTAAKTDTPRVKRNKAVDPVADARFERDYAAYAERTSLEDHLRAGDPLRLGTADFVDETQARAWDKAVCKFMLGSLDGFVRVLMLGKPIKPRVATALGLILGGRVFCEDTDLGETIQEIVVKAEVRIRQPKRRPRSNATVERADKAAREVLRREPLEKNASRTALITEVAEGIMVSPKNVRLSLLMLEGETTIAARKKAPK